MYRPCRWHWVAKHCFRLPGRFAYDGLKRQRLTEPLLRLEGEDQLTSATWEEALYVTAQRVRSGWSLGGERGYACDVCIDTGREDKEKHTGWLLQPMLNRDEYSSLVSTFPALTRSCGLWSLKSPLTPFSHQLSSQNGTESLSQIVVGGVS